MPMTFSDLLTTLRRRWPLVVLVPIVAAVVSVGAALVQPPRYIAQAEMLVTRSEDRRFDTEDALAYDLPAIVSGEPFARELAAELARRGRSIPVEQLHTMLGASNARRVVTIAATEADPAEAEAVLDAAVALVQTRGLALWGDPAATPADTGLNVVILSGIPPHAAPATTWRTIALDALVRAVVGLGVGVALAVVSQRR